MEENWKTLAIDNRYSMLEWWMKKFKDSSLPGKTITAYLIEYLESL